MYRHGLRLLAAGIVLAVPAAHAQKQTVCTITVNSPDEREVFRRSLPEDRYDFVELVEHGKPDWLAASCRKGVQCDVLLVSGHFAGTEFYSSRPDARETLPIDALERASCSDSCPGLFSQLKEVYLFGCDTLNPTPVRSATPEVATSLAREGASPDAARREAQALAERHGESALEHMRRLFPDVPVIYGFSSKAPYGRYAGPMLERHFASGSLEVGSGVASERLRRLFAPASMVVTEGQRDFEPNAGYRAEACRYFDTRLTAARKLEAIHETMRRSMAEARLELDRIENFIAGLDESERAAPAFVAALDALRQDDAVKSRFVTLARDTEDPAVRVRLVALARNVGWLDAVGERNELMRMVAQLLATPSTGFGEVELICTLNRDRALDAELPRLTGLPKRVGRATDAAMACLGSSEGRSRIVSALASRDEGEVQLAQAYLRHQPIEDADELRAVTLRVARMEGSGAQVRALETLARHHISDRAVLDELSRLYGRTRSPAVKRAVEEVFLRSAYRELSPAVTPRASGG